MSKLDNIPKKIVFTVPDGYFEKLPAEIQSRIPAESVIPGVISIYRFGLRYALPLLIVAVLIFYYTPSPPDAETILATVETSDLILYVQETSAPLTEDLLENIDISISDVEAIENEAYSLELEESGDEVLEFELNNL